MGNEPTDAFHPFTTTRPPDAARVGGKAASLVEMTRAGMPVPPGAVLTTGFFRPWLEELWATPEWNAFVAALDADEPSEEELRQRTTALTTACAGLTLTDTQQRWLSEALRESREPNPPPPDSGLFAVRSSAPQEDRTGASFAGMYKSVLGVPLGGLPEAIRAVFASGAAFRVVSYKLRHGLDPRQVEIAVIVQHQVASVSAGVAFSLNPQSNDYDETVIQANRGLGETVVSGGATPDRFVVDKTTQRVLTRELGSKDTTLWVRPEGGSAPGHGGPEGDDGFALTDGQAVEVGRLATRVEHVTTVPMDIEWAYAPDRKLWLLQARPVTTYFPLPDELRTAPGAPRRLYADTTLLEEGLQAPLSVLGDRWMADVIAEMGRQTTGRRIPTRAGDGLLRTVEGRWYVNVSPLLWLGRERLARSLETLDVHAARVMRNVDTARYRSATGKPKVSGVARLALGTVAGLADPAAKTLVGLVAPDRARRRYETAVARYRRRLAAVARETRSVPELGEGTPFPVVHLLVREGLPLTYAAETAKALLRLCYLGASRRHRRLLETALRSMPHNVTVEMGLALYRLACSLEESVEEEAHADLTALARRVEARDLPERFMSAWDAFMERYGFRGPEELDLASPRYADDPMLVLEQLRQYAPLEQSPRQDPLRADERRRRERHAAYRELLDETRTPLTAWLMRRLYRSAEAFSGFREIHKYHLVMAGYEIRRRALATGRELVERGRLDSPDQIFDLTYEDLREAARTPEMDPRARAHDNTGYRDKVARIPGARFPVMVDSRGAIPRPARRAAAPGTLVGDGGSTGVARGPAKVLCHVGEKPVLPGEILVARAMDPGWTPLLCTVAGVVLEIGGSFQHGVLVAREYGTPCVVAVEDATRRITDGQVVEIDGDAGTVTFDPDP